MQTSPLEHGPLEYVEEAELDALRRIAARLAHIAARADRIEQRLGGFYAALAATALSLIGVPALTYALPHLMQLLQEIWP